MFNCSENLINWLESSWYPLVGIPTIPLKRKTWVYLKEHRPCTPLPPPPQTTCWELNFTVRMVGSYPLGLLHKLVNFEKNIRPMYNKFELQEKNHLVTSCMTCARNYRPCFRENQPKRSFSMKWKRAFWACFRENWVYKFGHRDWQ
jgi:hypothetical protein